MQNFEEMIKNTMNKELTMVVIMMSIYALTALTIAICAIMLTWKFCFGNKKRQKSEEHEENHYKPQPENVRRQYADGHEYEKGQSVPAQWRSAMPAAIETTAEKHHATDQDQKYLPKS